METENKHRRLSELLAEQASLDRIQQVLSQRRDVNARQIAAYETLIALEADPNPEGPTLSELESLLGVSPGDAVGAGGDRETTEQPSVVETVGGSGSERVSEAELVRFGSCASIIEIADRFAALGDGTVYIARVTDIAEAKRWGNPRAKHPRKQIWLRVYSELKKANSYVYDGRGTGSFTRQSHPVGFMCTLERNHDPRLG